MEKELKIRRGFYSGLPKIFDTETIYCCLDNSKTIINGQEYYGKINAEIEGMDLVFYGIKDKKDSELFRLSFFLTDIDNTLELKLVKGEKMATVASVNLTNLVSSITEEKVNALKKNLEDFETIFDLTNTRCVYIDFDDNLKATSGNFPSTSTMLPRMKVIKTLGDISSVTQANHWFERNTTLQKIEKLNGEAIEYFYATFNSSSVELPATLNSKSCKMFIGCFDGCTSEVFPDLDCTNLQTIRNYQPMLDNGYTRDRDYNPFIYCFSSSNRFKNIPILKGLRFSPSVAGRWQEISTFEPTNESFNNFCENLGTPIDSSNNTIIWHSTVWEKIRALEDFSSSYTIAQNKGWTFRS